MSPTVLNTPTVLKISPRGNEHPHGTQDIPHGTHDIPHGTEHPQGTEHPHSTAYTLYRVRPKLAGKLGFITVASCLRSNRRLTG